jgi:7-cyano-7-deazaguanine synthase
MRLLLLSGGIESTCLAYSLRPEICVTINYGQLVASREIRASKYVCKSLGLVHRVAKIDLSRYGSGLLVGKPKDTRGAQPEWWPFRNQLLLTVGAMIGFKYGAKELLIGCVKSDRRHADGSKKFIAQINKLIFSQEGSLRVRAPAIYYSTEHLVEISKVPLGILALTFSCHRSIYPCGQCGGCRKNEAAISYAMRRRRVYRSSFDWPKTNQRVAGGSARRLD